MARIRTEFGELRTWYLGGTRVVVVGRYDHGQVHNAHRKKLRTKNIYVATNYQTRIPPIETVYLYIVFYNEGKGAPWP